MSNVMSFYNRSFIFKEGKLYKCKAVSFRDKFEFEEELVYDPAVHPIEALYRTFEEIFLAGHGEFQNKVKTLFDC